MHILPENLRSLLKRTSQYACAAVLGFQTDCTIVCSPISGCKLNQKVGA